jgi:hypothetical protein
MVHVATFFTDVRPELVLRFAKLHGIPARKLTSAYGEIKQATGEANPALENLLGQLAPTADRTLRGLAEFRRQGRERASRRR